jgi:hypothetical protein
MIIEGLSSIKIKFDGKAEDELSDAIKHHIETHDNVTLIDVIKFLYQSVLGSFHMLDYMSENETEAWIKRDLAIAEPEEKPLTEKLYGEKWIRLNLGAFKQKYGNDHKLLTELFIRGKEEKRVLVAELSIKLDLLLKLVVARKIRPLNSSANLPDLAASFLTDYKRRGFPPLYHSQSYSEKNPRYIVVSLNGFLHFWQEKIVKDCSGRKSMSSSS